MRGKYGQAQLSGRHSIRCLTVSFRVRDIVPRRMPPDRPLPQRPDNREVAELKAVASQHPELAAAAAMQIELVELTRRLQLRVSTPTLPSTATRQERLAAGGRVLEFSDLSLDWREVRLAVRQTADILHRYELIERPDHERLVALVRDETELAPAVRHWYEATASAATERPPMLDEVLPLAMRPFLARAVEVAGRGVDLADWRLPRCPFCAGTPELAVYVTDYQRLLICGRCAARWEWEATGCVFCQEQRPSRLPSFLSADRRYRVCACDTCRRYLKAYNAVGASRPVLPAVDLIATLPLDAAAAQRGYEA
jgi:ribosomal protein L40E